jgi:hypothetical protein
MINKTYGCAGAQKGKLYFLAQKSPIEGAEKWGLGRLLFTATLPFGYG